MAINDNNIYNNFAFINWADNWIDQGKNQNQNPIQFNQIDSTFSLTDIAEEITDVLAETVEEKRLDEHHLEEYKEPEIPDIVTITAMLGEMKDEAAANDLSALAKRLIQAAHNRNSLLLEMRKWSTDPSKQYLALAYAIQSDNKMDKRIRETLRDRLAEIVAQDGPSIRAGINTVAQASAFGNDKSAVDLFRSTYRDAVLGETTLSATLSLLIQRFGEELENGINLLRQALGADLAALQPSCQPERLHAILEDLYQLSVAITVLQRCRLIVDRMERNHPATKLQTLVLMHDIIKWTSESWVVQYHAVQLMEKYQLDHAEYLNQSKQHEAQEERHQQEQNDDHDEISEDEVPIQDMQINFLNGLMDILRSLPIKIFITPEHRLQAMAAVQQVMDDMLLPEKISE